MTEINGLDERIAGLKRCYQEAERLNLNYKAGELVADINYLEELRELRKKQEFFITAFDKISAEIKALSPEPTAFDVVDGNPVKDAIWETIGEVRQIIENYKTESEVKANENEK